MPIDSKFYKQKKSKSFYYSIGFLVFTLLLTWGLYGYNTMIKGNNTDLESEITRLDTSITKLKDDENVKAYSLYVSNQKTFDALAAQSQIPEFIKEVKKTLATFWLELAWFNYNDGKVAVKVISESDTRSQSYEKVVKFLQNYRLDENALFTLDTISWVTGQSKMNFDVNFVLKK